jgi:sugar lactone lactonase YvrE
MTSAFRASGLAAAFGLSLLFLVGCGAGPEIPGSIKPDVTAGVQGTAYGGSTPIVGATISLMAAGTSGYGSAPVQLSTTTTGAGGSFTLPSHMCPTPDSLVYVQALGGNPGSYTGNNSINLIAVLGNCSAATSQVHVSINEATTIAAAYALAQFASVTASHTWIGTSSTNIVGLNNAAGPASTLVNSTTGVPNVTSSSAGIVLPTAVIDTLADMLAACTNSTGASSSGCNTLFNATTVNGVRPVDTLQAALNIALHISIDATGNAWVSTFNTTATLTGLIEITPTGQYPGGSTGFGNNVLAPSVGVNVDQQGIIWVNNTNDGALTGFTSNGSVYTSVPGLNSPNGQAIDGSGNIWADAGGNANNTFVEILKSGTNYTLQPVKTAAAHFGTGICISPTYLYETAPGAPGEAAAVTVVKLSDQSITTITPDSGYASLSGCSVDNAGNIWLPDGGNFQGIEVYNSAGALLNSFPMNSATYPQEMAIDGLGNAFVSAYISQTVPETIVEFSSTGTLLSPTLGYAPTTGAVNSKGTALVGLTDIITTDPGGVAIDASGNLWLSGTNGGTALPTYVTEVIGLAAPVVTPKSLAITNNTIATRP